MNNVEKGLKGSALELYESVKDLPIVSPHGHCDPSWWSENTPIPDPASLLIIPDHYVFRMLYSQGVPLENIGIGVEQHKRDPRAIFQVFADHWHCFLGTPSRQWLEYTFSNTFGISQALTPESADQIYDQISEKLEHPSFRPRTLLQSLNIEILATTDAINDDLAHHAKISTLDCDCNILPTLRPDSVLNPTHASYLTEVTKLGDITKEDISNYNGFLRAIRKRRQYFIKHGATATDHDVPDLNTNWLEQYEIEMLHTKAIQGTISTKEALSYYGHLLIEMAQMSIDDGLVMQLHVGSTRNTNKHLFKTFGSDMGADIPKPVNWVEGLSAFLNRVGNNSNLKVLLFTLDESTYSRELAPMAGHWPCLKIGPPWWFHDSLDGMRRYLDQVVETAGYFNLAGFNDDTRAFLSIPARHDMWRRAISIHLAEQINNGRFGMADAKFLAPKLARDFALEAYNLKSEIS